LATPLIQQNQRQQKRFKEGCAFAGATLKSITKSQKSRELRAKIWLFLMHPQFQN